MGLGFTSEDDFQINNIIMNPPYNNDIYLLFIKIAHDIAKDNVISINPAKHYFLNNTNEYDMIHKELLEYTQKIVFYQCEGEIFKICLPSGIMYSLITKQKSDTIEVLNKSEHFEAFRNQYITVKNDTQTFNTRAIPIINKIDNKGLDIEYLDKNKQYRMCARKHCYVQGGSSNKSRGIFYYDENFLPGFITVASIKSNDENDDIGIAHVVASFDTELERDSFMSFCDTKLIRYLLNCRVSAYSNMYINEVWKLVPNGIQFDHIFTDEELYKKYSLTDSEIEIIESVIKERK